MRQRVSARLHFSAPSQTTAHHGRARRHIKSVHNSARHISAARHPTTSQPTTCLGGMTTRGTPLHDSASQHHNPEHPEPLLGGTSERFQLTTRRHDKRTPAHRTALLGGIAFHGTTTHVTTSHCSATHQHRTPRLTARHGTTQLGVMTKRVTPKHSITRRHSRATQNSSFQHSASLRIRQHRPHRFTVRRRDGLRQPKHAAHQRGPWHRRLSPELDHRVPELHFQPRYSRDALELLTHLFRDLSGDGFPFQRIENLLMLLHDRGRGSDLRRVGPQLRCARWCTRSALPRRLFPLRSHARLHN